MEDMQEDDQSWSIQVKAELIALDELLSGTSGDAAALEAALPRLQSLIEKMEKVASGNTSR
jgi:hypothetical protein